VKRTPLVRKTRLRAGGGINRTVRLARETPLRKVSKRRRSKMGERRKFVAEVLAATSICELPGIIEQALETGNLPKDDDRWFHLQCKCHRHAVDVHEILTRGRGGAFVPSDGLTRDGVLALCRPCHDWVTTHPEKAAHLGAVAHSWSNRYGTTVYSVDQPLKPLTPAEEVAQAGAVLAAPDAEPIPPEPVAGFGWFFM
jgi:hypothetical protein